jgi:hypothetical protein
MGEGGARGGCMRGVSVGHVYRWGWRGVPTGSVYGYIGTL